MVVAFEESGNLFSEDSQVLVVLDSKEVMGEKTASSLSEVVEIGQSQYIIILYEKCVDERVKQLSIPISNIMIPKNKVSPFHEGFTYKHSRIAHGVRCRKKSPRTHL